LKKPSINVVSLVNNISLLIAKTDEETPISRGEALQALGIINAAYFSTQVGDWEDGYKDHCISCAELYEEHFKAIRVNTGTETAEEVVDKINEAYKTPPNTKQIRELKKFFKGKQESGDIAIEGEAVEENKGITKFLRRSSDVYE
jgi:hypothetical protein